MVADALYITLRNGEVYLHLWPKIMENKIIKLGLNQDYNNLNYENVQRYVMSPFLQLKNSISLTHN